MEHIGYPEISTLIYIQVIFIKGAKKMKWEMISSSINSSGESG